MTTHSRLSALTLRAILATLTLVGVVLATAAHHWESIRPVEWTPIDWRPFSRQAAKQENSLGRDVLVRFSASWDPSSVVQLHWIDIPPIRRLVHSKQIATMNADCTHDDPEIKAELESLGSSGEPLLVIYPASGGAPIVMQDMVAAEQLITRLREL
jgi:thiol:disulfide interchange protein DsbD